MSKKIIVIASVSIALLLVVLIAVNSENNIVETITIDLPTSEIPNDAKSEMSQTLLVEAKYKPSKGVISVFYEDKSKMTDKLIIDGKEFCSRLFIGTGKHRNLEELEKYILSSESELITVAIRRLDLENKSSKDTETSEPKKKKAE